MTKQPQTTLDGSELIHGVLKSLQDEGLPMKIETTCQCGKAGCINCKPDLSLPKPQTTYCPACGGIVGRDCFNVPECIAITQDMQRRAEEAADGNCENCSNMGCDQCQ